VRHALRGHGLHRGHGAPFAPDDRRRRGAPLSAASSQHRGDELKLPVNFPVTFDDIVEAARRIEGAAVATPLVESPLLNRIAGGRVLVKAEGLQRTGSFKFRGAFNRLSQFDDDARRAGVVAYSSGNHAQGIAAAAALLDIPAVIVMPADAPAIKIENTKAHGAEIILYDRARENREEIGARIAAERSATLVPSFDDAGIIAGQGTVGLEIAAAAKAMGATLDAVLIPCGGGGLSSGTAIALKTRCPGSKIFIVEPEGFDDWARSLKAGRRLANAPGAQSFCDALLAPMPGELTFEINSRLLSGAFTVADEAVAKAMKAAFSHLKLVLEPGGAIALAAVLSGGFDCHGKTVGVVCSGANVDAETFCRAITGT
jgi:threonine dehydratase